MRDIITIENKIPVVDTRDMAKGFEMQHRSIMRLIDIHEVSIKRFGKVRFQITPTDSGQNQRHCMLTESQATFVGTLMNNKGRAVEFKIQLVEEFEKMKNFIKNQQIIRSVGIETRKSLTDSIEESGENERMHGKGHSNYTRMVYDLVGLKEEHKEWKKEHPDWKKKHLIYRDYITDPEKLIRVEQAEALIKPMLELDKQYQDIKDTLKPLFERKGIE